MTLDSEKRLASAFAYALKLHGSQLRKGTQVPYVSHLMAVCSLVFEHGGTYDEAIAALLHDAVEDQGGEPVLAKIRDDFGAQVADIVDGCTDAYVEPKPPWRARKESYLERLVDASASVLLVSASDKLHNSRAILLDYRAHREALWDRFRGGREGTLWYYRALVEAYQRNARHDRVAQLTAEIERVVTQLEALASADTGLP